MKIVPEKVFVQPNLETAELVVVMDGFRLTLSRSESETLRDGLSLGLKKLDPTSGDSRRPALVGTGEGEGRPEARRMGLTSP
jgi:hypothetical protein